MRITIWITWQWSWARISQIRSSKSSLTSIVSHQDPISRLRSSPTRSISHSLSKWSTIRDGVSRARTTLWSLLNHLRQRVWAITVRSCRWKKGMHLSIKAARRSLAVKRLSWACHTSRSRRQSQASIGKSFIMAWKSNNSSKTSRCRLSSRIL